MDKRNDITIRKELKQIEIWAKIIQFSMSIHLNNYSKLNLGDPCVVLEPSCSL